MKIAVVLVERFEEIISAIYSNPPAGRGRSVEEAEQMKQTLSKQKYDQSQELKRYRSSKKLFTIKNKQQKHSIYMSCARLSSISNVRKLGMSCLPAEARRRQV